MRNLKELRMQLEFERHSGRGRVGRGFSKELREQVREHIEGERKQGRTYAAIAEAIGLSLPTVASWSRRSPTPGTFHPLKVIGGGTGGAPRRAPITILGPLGTRIDGLELDEVVELWRRLGC